MTRIQDLGEACDDAIRRMREIMKGKNVPDDSRNTEVQMKAAGEVIHAYFDYSDDYSRS